MNKDVAEDRNGASASENLRYDEADGTYHLTVDTESESVSTSLVVAVAEVLERDPTGLDPLSAQLDPDALDALFEGPSADESLDGLVRFTFADCLISVYARGDVVIEPPAGRPSLDR